MVDAPDLQRAPARPHNSSEAAGQSDQSNEPRSPSSPSSPFLSASSISDVPSSPRSNSTRQRRLPPFSASTPSTSVFSTPDALDVECNAFANLPSSHQASTSMQIQQRSEVIQENNILDNRPTQRRLTSESLQPLSAGGPSKTRAETPSIASSSEAYDALGPLPQSAHSASNRPSLPRGKSLPASTLTHFPLPSPPAAGLSELFAGSSISRDEGYFAGHHQRNDDLGRSNSFTKRIPPYSPFITNYGPVQSVRPRNRHMSDNSVSKSDALATSSPGTRSEANSSDSQGSRSHRSPRVRNSDGILAPHGTFTSARSPSSATTSRSPSVKAASDSQLRGYGRPMYAMPPTDPGVLNALQKAAKEGDQLASYRLGIVPDPPHGERYSWGSKEAVWGLPSPAMTTRRSSFSSRGSGISAKHDPIDPHMRTPNSNSSQSDLFSDAAHLTMQNNTASHASQDRRRGGGHPT